MMPKYLQAFLALAISTAWGQPCQLDDIQQTPGSCIPIKSCRHVIGQLYAGGRPKRCSGELVCCPTKPTLSQKSMDLQ